MRKKPTEKKESIENDIITFETFRKMGSYEMGNLKSNEATCFNGNVNVRKYKVTIELIEEPNELIIKRLQKLWDECDNDHYWTPLRIEAKKYNYEFPNSPYTKRNK